MPSKGNSEERARMMRALGAEVVLVDQLPESVRGQASRGDLELVNQAAQRITAERGAFRADQFHREGNWLAHYQNTGPEIWDASDGSIDGFTVQAHSLHQAIGGAFVAGFRQVMAACTGLALLSALCAAWFIGRDRRTR